MVNTGVTGVTAGFENPDEVEFDEVEFDEDGAETGEVGGEAGAIMLREKTLVNTLKYDKLNLRRTRVAALRCCAPC